MSKGSCEAAEKRPGATLRMARAELLPLCPGFTVYIPTAGHTALRLHALHSAPARPRSPSPHKMPASPLRGGRKYIIFLLRAPLPIPPHDETALFRYRSRAYPPIHGCLSNQDLPARFQTTPPPPRQSLLMPRCKTRRTPARRYGRCFLSRRPETDNPRHSTRQ